MATNNLNDLSQREYFERIGRGVVAGQEKRRQTNAKMHDTWLAEGKPYKTVRETLDISQAKISNSINADKSVIRRYVKRRPVVTAAYKLALENISLKRLNIVSSLSVSKKDEIAS